MAWSNLPAAQNTDWTGQSFFNQFNGAVNERGTYVGGFAVPLDDVVGNTISGSPASPPLTSFGLSGIAELQKKLEEIALSSPYVDKSLVNFTAAPIDWLNWSWTLSAFRSDAGLNANGFKRKYPRQIDDVIDPGASGQVARHTGDGLIYDYATAWQLSLDQTKQPDLVIDFGIALGGDYVGPWIFNELQSASNVIETIWVYITGVGQPTESYFWFESETEFFSSSRNPPVTYSTASAARSAASSDPDPTITIGTSVGAGSNQSLFSGKYGASRVQVNRASIAVLAGNSAISATFELWYSPHKRGSASGGVFSSTGLNLQEDTYTIVQSGALSWNATGTLGAGFYGPYYSTDMPPAWNTNDPSTTERQIALGWGFDHNLHWGDALINFGFEFS